MFEAIVTLCLSLESGPCRDHLLPGFEAASASACVARLGQSPPNLHIAGLVAKGAPQCAPTGTTFEMAEVAEGVFVHRGAVAEPDMNNRGNVSNLGFVVGERSVAVIDSGTARWMGEATWRAIRAVTDKPVSHVILTHMHPDHVFGASVLVEGGALAVGHRDLPRALIDRQVNYLASLARLIGAETMLGTEVTLLDDFVETTAEIDLGGRVLELETWPTSHTGTDLTVLDRESGILFAGDLVFDRHTPALDGSLLGWRAVIAELAQREITGVVPGHGGPLLEWPVGAADMARYLGVLERDTRRALDAGERLGEAVARIAAEEQEYWELFEAYNPRNATVAFTELEWE
ncbi:beta-lactamase domain protein [Dinoroseobacter shibae DFL 12 = DSM 16493]|uniref:Beta-lactamase domain protein n=2 Tax=Dinoroseobacter shibae TaxID=215813 RepID=A8LNR1_DINSH|nr:beta-lactamase domain protein [Dinoroseobacter shibae DFL 12 = DSM 16493]